MKGGGTVDHSNRLEELVTRYENTLFRTALAILGDVPEAEDAVQDVYPAPDGDSREVLEAVLALPPKQRAAVHLHYYEGYTTDEIAAILGQRPGTVRSHLSRARQALKEQLKGEK